MNPQGQPQAAQPLVLNLSVVNGRMNIASNIVEKKQQVALLTEALKAIVGGLQEPEATPVEAPIRIPSPGIARQLLGGYRAG